MDLEERVHEIEKNQLDIYARLGKVEDKASGAWKTIAEVNNRMDQMEHRIGKVEEGISHLQDENKVIKEDVKIVKSQQGGINRKLKILIAVVSVLSVISVGFFVYIWKHDAELAKSILALGSTIAKTVA